MSDTDTPQALANGSDARTSDFPSLGKVVNRLAGALERETTPGDLAALRRLDPDDPSNPAFWRIVVGHLVPVGALSEERRDRDQAEACWAALLSGMAQMHGLHVPGRRLGRALAAAGLSELRFVRLLRARERQLLSEVRTAARYLAARAEPVDWVDFARLVLSHDTKRAESVRRGIARDYYSAQEASPTKEKS